MPAILLAVPEDGIEKSDIINHKHATVAKDGAIHTGMLVKVRVPITTDGRAADDGYGIPPLAHLGTKAAHNINGVPAYAVADIPLCVHEVIARTDQETHSRSERL